jgi:hypothetical protein
MLCYEQTVSTFWTTLVHLLWSRDVVVATWTKTFHFRSILGPSVRHIFYTSVLTVVDKQVSLFLKTIFLLWEVKFSER